MVMAETRGKTGSSAPANICRYLLDPVQDRDRFDAFDAKDDIRGGTITLHKLQGRQAQRPLGDQISPGGYHRQP